MHQKLAPDVFLILLSNPKESLHARNSFKGKVFRKRINKKPLKQKTLFFLSKLVSSNGQSYQKQKGLELVTSCSSGHITSSEKFLYSLYVI